MKRLSLLSLILLMTHASWLMAQNSMALTSAQGRPQDIVEIELSITNTDSFVAFQTEIPLGNNITFVEGSDVLYRGNGHDLAAAVVEGTLKLYAYSFSNTAFTGNDGKVASFKLKLGNEPGVFPLNNTKAKIVSSDGSSLSLTTTDATLTVVSPKAQVLTTQLDYGHVPIRSSYNKTLSVKNIGNEAMTISELQFSDESLSCPSFTETVVEVGGAASFNIVYSPTVSGEVNYTIIVNSNAVNGAQTVSVVADPYSVNELHIISKEDYCDSTVSIPIKVNNMDALTGFQLAIKMPEALLYQNGSFKLSSRATDHIAEANMRNDTLVMIAYSSTNSTFSDEDGVIATFDVKIKGTSGYHYLYPRKVKLVNTNAENVLSDTYNGYVRVKSPKIRVDFTHEFKDSSITEAVESSFTIRNNGDAPLRIDEIFFDDTYLTCSTQLPLVINNYESSSISIRCDKDTEGDFQSSMRIYSNDPTTGLVFVDVKGYRYEPNGLEIDNKPVTEMKYLDVVLKMNNYSDITAIQANFSYPNKYYTLQSSDITLAERCQEGFSWTSVAVDDSTFKLIMYSLSNKIISGNEGAVFNIRLTRKDEADNSSATVSVKDIILSDVKGVNKNSEGDKRKKINLLTTSTTTLKKGWNWYSTYLNISGEEGLNILKEKLGDKATIIKSQKEFTLYYPDYNVWDGSLKSLDNKTFYMISMSEQADLSLEGLLVDMNQFEIIIKPGWNWITNSYYEGAAINDVNFGFSPTDGDLIKSQTKFAEYYEGYGWDGSLDIIETGGSYMYFNASTENKIMKFNSSNN